MSRLLENAMKNRYQGNIFDYFDNKKKELTLPVPVKDPEWETVTEDYKTCLYKRYDIPDVTYLKYLTCEIIDMCSQLNHMPVLEIDEHCIGVCLYTKHINDVTDVDLKLSKDIDAIAKDVIFLMSNT